MTTYGVRATGGPARQLDIDATAEHPPSGRSRDATALLVLAAVLGTAATSLLVAAGTGLGRDLVGVHLWFFDGPSALSVDRLGQHRAIALNDAGLGMLVLAWLLVWLIVRERAASVRALVLVGLAWALPLVVGPPLFSPDAYAYTAIGASLHHGVDAYRNGPAAAGDIPAVRGAEPFWRNTPTPYSPPFLDLIGAVSWLVGERMLAALVALRGIALLATAAVALLLPRLARRSNRDGSRALWLGVLNPLLLLTAVSANHNDILMMALLVPGLLLAVRNRPLLAIVLCTAAAGVKVIALPVVVVIGVDYALRQDGWPARLRALAVSGVVGLAAFAGSVAVSGRGWGWLHNLSVPDIAVEPLTPVVALATVLRPGAPPVDAARRAGAVLAVAVCLLLLTRLRRWGVVRVSAWVLLTLVLLGTVVWPWYLTWAFLLFAAAGGRREAQLVVLGSVAMLFTTLPGGQPALDLLGRPQADRLVLAVLAAAALYAGVSALTGRLASRRPVAGPGQTSL